MGGVVGKIMGVKKPDTSAQERQIQEQREQIQEDKKTALIEERQLAEQRSAKRRATQRGGKRALLSTARVAPETGLEEETLGSA